MSNPELFKEQKYLLLQNVIPKDICNIATKYALMKQEVQFTPEGDDSQIPGTHSVYGDTLMETLMHFMHPHMEANTGLSLFPTYAYYRVYRPGDELLRHKDRESCEISTTVCLGFKYITNQTNYNWGMYVDRESDTDVNFTEDAKGYQSLNRPGKELTLNPGDIIVYRGCEIEHWRDKFEVEEGSYLVQAFLHYVDANGPNASFKYDKRPGLGYPTSSKRK
jgi:hypothetical protein